MPPLQWVDIRGNSGEIGEKGRLLTSLTACKGGVTCDFRNSSDGLSGAFAKSESNVPFFNSSKSTPLELVLLVPEGESSFGTSKMGLSITPGPVA